MKIDFCLPVYNEGEILEKNTIRLLDFCFENNFSFDWKIILIINGSDDSSSRIAARLSENYSKIEFMNIREKGKGQALKKCWIQSKSDILFFTDIDLAPSLEKIPELIDFIREQDYDLVVGSRLLPDSEIKRSFIREVTSRSFNFLSRLILNHNFSDTQCGFKAIKNKTFKKISPYIKNKSWFFDTELVVFSFYLGYKVKEIPIEWEENRHDKRKTKVRLVKDGLHFFLNLILLRKRITKISKENVRKK